MLPSQIPLLHPSTPTPYASFRGRPIDNRVFVQDFIICWHYEATSADNTVRGYSHGVMHTSTCRYRVEVAHTRRFHTCNIYGHEVDISGLCNAMGAYGTRSRINYRRLFA